ncbi:MAG: GerMN domain-containing protein [Clostridiales bacterium]|jgi:hypothetical protein|nr:GerMN domain-containing protein [Clostridiales bacterium]
MRKLLVLTAIMALLLGALVGCTRTDTSPQPRPPEREEEQDRTETVTLYYANSQVQYLLAEERVITVPEGVTLAYAVVSELLHEPVTPDAALLMPAETEVLGVTVESGLITVDVNQNFRDNFYGGSSSEAFLIYSIVNTLTELEGLEDHEVRFLINGEPFDTIGGHMSAEEHFTRSEELIN